MPKAKIEVSVNNKLMPSITGVNPDQKNVLKTIASPENHIIFVNGIAGVGKTFLAASWGLSEMLKGRFEKMIVSRPYVEAGEKLGFLPGGYDSKIAPFMIPIFDTFKDHISKENIEILIKTEKIITLPLAYMRGVTFKKAFVLLDEAQNSTKSQMHLFLTRIGESSKMVITGDTTQSDIEKMYPSHGVNGFTDAISRLDGVQGLQIVNMSPDFIVRHEIIPHINERYK